MEVYPELLTEMAINAAKAFFRSDQKGSLPKIVAEELERFKRIHKTDLTDTQLQTVCQMANRAVHKNAFKKNKLVKFELATVKKVRSGGKTKPAKEVPPTQLPMLTKQGRRKITASAPKETKKKHLSMRTRLPGHRQQAKRESADTVQERFGDLTGVLNKAIRHLTAEEVLGLAVVLDAKRGSNVLTKLVQGALEKNASMDLNKVASFTGMTPEADHPVVAAMSALLDAAEEYQAASRRLDNAWVG